MTGDAGSAPPVAVTPAPGAARGRGHPVARRWGAVLGWLAALVAVAGLVVRLLDTRSVVLVLLASAAYALAPLSVVALGLGLWRRSRTATLAAVVVIAIQSCVYGPLFVADPAPRSAVTVRVLTLNLRLGHADPAHVVSAVRSASVDVFAAQELTPDAVVALRRAGLDDLLPYAVTDPRTSGRGTGLWSRHPLTDAATLTGRGVPGVTARVTLPGGVQLAVGSVHPAYPGEPSDWYAQLGRLRQVLSTTRAGPAVVAGDVNSTEDHARFRALLVRGWHDGADQAGAGWLRSWPSDRPVPPLVGIDHVLTRGAVATAVATVSAPGSDHLALLATVAVPR